MIKNLTTRGKIALEIIRDYGPITPKRFAEFFWPRDKWTWAIINTGRGGAHKGRGMYIAAGCYLAKLAKAGWAREIWRNSFGHYRREGYILTDEGKRILKDAFDMSERMK